MKVVPFRLPIDTTTDTTAGYPNGHASGGLKKSVTRRSLSPVQGGHPDVALVVRQGEIEVIRADTGGFESLDSRVVDGRSSQSRLLNVEGEPRVGSPSCYAVLPRPQRGRQSATVTVRPAIHSRCDGKGHDDALGGEDVCHAPRAGRHVALGEVLVVDAADGRSSYIHRMSQCVIADGHLRPFNDAELLADGHAARRTASDQQSAARRVRREIVDLRDSILNRHCAAIEILETSGDPARSVVQRVVRGLTPADNDAEHSRAAGGMELVRRDDLSSRDVEDVECSGHVTLVYPGPI